jgi:hypothetical protein
MGIDIRRSLKKFAPHFLQARKDGLNEADTVLRLCRFFEEVLGYDGLQDISRETQLKHKFIDICLKIDGRIRLLIEVKSADQPLRDRHIEQAQTYASQNNFRWVLLTNGVEWNLYHLTFEEGIEYERAFVASLADDTSIDDAAQKLSILHKQSIRKGELDLFWEKATALCAGSIGKVLFSETVLRLLRRELRRETGQLIDTEDLAKSIHEMLCTEAREQIGPMRIRKKRRVSRKPEQVAAKEPATVETPAMPDESDEPINQGS